MSMSLEEQIKTLQDCGIKLRPGVTIKYLLSLFNREQYEEDPYNLLLAVMGAELEEEPYENISDDVWHVDTECIEDHGDYVAIAMRMKDLAGGALPLEEVDDYVDVEAEEAWLSFKLNGKEIKWVAEVDNDWVDPSIFSRFAKLLAEQNTNKRFTYLDLGGQDCIIGCCTSEQLEKLKQKTDLNFEWLT